jgi:transcriptional regulator with PAS, ATPase and Fis domain
MNGNKVTGITPKAMSILEKYKWPGNVRELRNAMEKMVVLSSGGMLDVADIPSHMRNHFQETEVLATGTLEETERAKIFAALKNANGNKTLAAEKLGISRRTLYRKLDEYEKEGFSS